ncbi:uncharacterized protein LOC111491306 [Cucurbita maxima]|uniref:Uncharacterized protein LOC111491306 n=1 Tax=Cucurbita maxima TaxID=3661 RepID=A0A6J1K3A7_CUCMA|nr:uncharacterized protein LOC111491306 [Cucurbita maxima]
MGMSKRVSLVFFVLLFTILLPNPMEAARVMSGEKWMKAKQDMAFVLPIQVLQRAPVPPSGRNPCSTIPGQSNGRCTLQTMNVAGGPGRFVQAPPAIHDPAPIASAAQSS